MAQVAMIDDRDNKVVNLGVAGRMPDAAGYTLLIDTSWSDPAAEVYVGQVWENRPELPAIFSWPVVDPDAEVMTMSEATAARDVAMLAVQKANAAIDRLLS